MGRSAARCPCRIVTLARPIEELDLPAGRRVRAQWDEAAGLWFVFSKWLDDKVYFLAGDLIDDGRRPR